MTEHEKRIREASNYALDNEWSYPVVENNDLRALLADLDAVRGALEEICSLDPHESSATEWNAALRKGDAALKGAAA